MLYILANPFKSKNNGVSSYIDNFCKVFNKSGIKDKIDLLKYEIYEGESICEFRIRLKEFYLKNKENIFCIEAPESLAVTLLLPLNAPIHIRLHFSKAIGEYIQGRDYDLENFKNERVAIQQAKWISAPSQVAFLATNFLFKIDRKCIFYPNPFYFQRGLDINLENKVYDLLFLGRFECLKGIDYVDKLFNRFNKKNNIIITDRTINFKCKNTKIFLTDQVNKIDLLEKSKILILPSLFETASMVAMEAISANCHVVTWKHIGICEYFDEELVSRVSFDKINDFENKIKICLNKFLEKTSDTREDAFQDINNRFLQAIEELLKNEDGGNYLRASLSFECSEIDVGELINQIRSKNRKGLTMFNRKLKKLINRPSEFFRDSKVVKSLRSNILKAEEGEIKKNDEAFIVNEVKYFSISTIGNIPKKGEVKLSKTKWKVNGLNFAIFLPKTFEEANYKKIQNIFNRFDDFQHLNKDYLNICTFNPNINDLAPDLYDRLSKDTVKNISEINHLILIDAPVSLCEALRACSSVSRVLYIDSKGVLKSNLNKLCDAVICKDIEGGSVNRGHQRILYYTDYNQLAYLIRKVVFEGVKKEVDYFFPIIGCKGLDKKYFLSSNDSHFDGLIFVEDGEEDKDFESMHDFYFGFSKKIKHMAIKESVYLRYKNWADNIYIGDNLINLIEQSQIDGYVFDVKNMGE